MRLQRNFPNIAQSVYDPHKFQFNSGNSQKGEVSNEYDNFKIFLVLVL